MTTSAPISPRSVGEADVLAKADYFLDVQIWPLQARLNPRGWLQNFGREERDHAIHLLNGFLYFSPSLVDQMFQTAFQSISSRLHTAGNSYLTLQSNWHQFVDTVIITHVTGEAPNPTDSGYEFARKARNLLEIPESRILSPDDAVRRLVTQPGPVVFVDDFVGSGNQFLTTWHRSVPIIGGTSSFARIASASPASFHYCPIISTQYGYDRLRHYCPSVIVQPAHILSSRYDAFAPDSFIWPSALAPTATTFIQKASFRAGIPDTGGDVNDWRGFHSLGLALGIGDSVPDATLPIFYWEENGWIPLLRRK